MNEVKSFKRQPFTVEFSLTIGKNEFYCWDYRAVVKTGFKQFLK